MDDRRKCQDYTHLLPKIRETEQRGTLSSDTAIMVFGIGCFLVLYGICILDYFGIGL